MATPQRPTLVIGDLFTFPQRGQAKVLAFKDGGLLVAVEGQNEIIRLEDAASFSGKGGQRLTGDDNDA